MTELPNLDHLDDLDRGELPQPEPAKPSDTETKARCLWPMAASQEPTR